MKSSIPKRRWLFVALLTPLLLLYVWSQFSKELRFVRSIGAKNLRTYVTELHQRGSWKLADGELLKEMWHKAFANHGVVAVKPYTNGLLVVFKRSDRYEQGVYIQSNQSESPYDGSGISFKELADGIYRFEQKNRLAYSAPQTSFPNN